jgi:hypothetical protein
MNRYFNTPFLFSLLIYFFLAIPSLYGQNIITGTIQFPNIGNVPSVRVYCCGRKIKPFTHDETKRIIFDIPKNPAQQRFYILITDTIVSEKRNTPGLSIQNTIDHLKVPSDKPYKLYCVERPILSHDQSSINERQPIWSIRQERLPRNGYIPDDAIIIRYHPHCVAQLEGGTPYALPTIIIKNNIVNLLGSEQKLYDYSNALIIASIDSDTIHADIQQEIKHDNHRITVSPSA